MSLFSYISIYWERFKWIDFLFIYRHLCSIFIGCFHVLQSFQINYWINFWLFLTHLFGLLIIYIEVSIIWRKSPPISRPRLVIALFPLSCRLNNHYVYLLTLSYKTFTEIIPFFSLFKSFTTIYFILIYLFPFLSLVSILSILQSISNTFNLIVYSIAMLTFLYC